jgi:hypothetical protein
MARRYSTEIRGDGATRTWTLPHGLDDPKPTVSLRDAASRDVSGTVRYAWPSAHEVAITFAEPPPVGMRYQVEAVTRPGTDTSHGHRARVG